MFRFLCLTVALSAVLVSAAAPARAQDVMTKESVASLKASFVADLDTLHQKFLGLAQAFPRATTFGGRQCPSDQTEDRARAA